MEWYMPLTVLPAVGLIVISTSNIMLALNDEITQLVRAKDKNDRIIDAKLSQLKKISISIVFQYIAILLFLFSGMLMSLFENIPSITKALLLVGVVAITISISILLIYSIKAVSIRQKYLRE